MAEVSLHDLSSFLNRLFCRDFSFEPQKLHIFHAVCCCAGIFALPVLELRPKQNVGFQGRKNPRRMRPVHAQARHEADWFVFACLRCGEGATITRERATWAFVAPNRRR